MRLIPGVAVIALSGCASRPVPSSASPAMVGGTTTAASPQLDVRTLIREQSDPRWWPIELMLTPELREGCRPVAELPPKIVLNDETEQAGKLEPLVSCLALGLPKVPRLHLAGETELAGVVQASGSGHASTFSAMLAKLGVPLEMIQLHHVDTGRSIEVGIEQSTS